MKGTTLMNRAPVQGLSAAWEAHANFPQQWGRAISPEETGVPAQLRRYPFLLTGGAAGSPWNHLLPALSHRPTEGSVSKKINKPVKLISKDTDVKP